MYTYRLYNRYSTKEAEIRGEDGRVVGRIKRTYPNLIMRIIDIFMEGLFTDYKVFNAEGNLKFEAIQVRNLFKKRQYVINYFTDSGTLQIHLIDKKRFDIGEKTSFEFEGKTYYLNKPLIGWGDISLDGVVVAEWKETLTIPLKADFRLVDPLHEEHILILLGIFHTYLHSPK
ncbi:hypothetical protein [Paenibacillus algorifonticola]|uniref:tubby C-terminal domain-like protein n=1 Tax=Paenibacillus algorifonticola TaxID=684063 RepID=UPI0006191949|nr:hypothetical protein [Paenibacillus algorifonticola]